MISLNFTDVFQKRVLKAKVAAATKMFDIVFRMLDDTSEFEIHLVGATNHKLNCMGITHLHNYGNL